MTQMADILILKNQLVELKGGKLVKSAIKLPNNTEYLASSYYYSFMPRNRH